MLGIPFQIFRVGLQLPIDRSDNSVGTLVLSGGARQSQLRLIQRAVSIPSNGGRALGLPDFRGQVDCVLRFRIWQASPYLVGLMFPRAVCLRWVL